MYKVLIVGCGKIAGYFSDFGKSNKDDNYVAAFRSNGKFELSGCVDLDQERAAKFSHSAGIPYNSDDLSKAIAKVRPDVISIATPDETHFGYAASPGVSGSLQPRPEVAARPINCLAGGSLRLAGGSLRLARRRDRVSGSL